MGPVSKTSFKRLLIVTCVCATVGGIATGVAFGTYYSVRNVKYEKEPKFKVKQFYLSGLDQSLVERTPEAQSSFVIETENKSKKMDIHYETFYVRVETQHKGIKFGESLLPGFIQSSKSVTKMIGNTSTLGVPTLDQEKQDFLQEARKLKKLQLSIRLEAQTTYRYGKDRTKNSRGKFPAQIHCKLDIDPQILTGSQLFWQSCKVDRFGCLVDCRHCNTCSSAHHIHG